MSSSERLEALAGRQPRTLLLTTTRRFKPSSGTTISTFSPSTDSVDTLITSADQALYQAKAQGKNQVCLAEV